MTSGVTLKIKYSCHGCGVEDREVVVPERGAEQDVVQWVSFTCGVAITEDHHKASPLCPADRFDLKIPMANADARVGVAQRQ